MQYVSHGRFLIPPKGYENENKRINFSIQQNYINFGFCCWVNQMLKYVRVCLFHKLVWWLIIPLIILVIDVQHHYSLAHLYLMEILFQLMFRICNYGWPQLVWHGCQQAKAPKNRKTNIGPFPCWLFQAMCCSIESLILLQCQHIC